MLLQEYATDLNITSWPSWIAFNAVKECFEAWIHHRGGIENQELTQILSQVRSFFETHRESQFTTWEEAGKTQIKTRDRVGFSKKNEYEQTEYYVSTEAY